MQRIRHYFIKKLGGFVDQTEQREYFWRTVRTETQYSLIRQILNRVKIEDLKKIVDTEFEERKKRGHVDYSLMADLIEKISKY